VSPPAPAAPRPPPLLRIASHPARASQQQQLSNSSTVAAAAPEMRTPRAGAHLLSSGGEWWLLCAAAAAAAAASKGQPEETMEAGCSLAGVRALPYCDPTNAPDQRIADLLARINASEKVSRLVSDPAPQLSGEAAGLPAYEWGVEGQVMSFDGCLNQFGCSDPTDPRCYICGQTFPMPPALAATFNLSLVAEIGSVVGDSVRALDNWRRNMSRNAAGATKQQQQQQQQQRALSVRGPCACAPPPFRGRPCPSPIAVTNRQRRWDGGRFERDA
jgi:hypothetical protein